jgi:hypothetical protein
VSTVQASCDVENNALMTTLFAAIRRRPDACQPEAPGRLGRRKVHSAAGRRRPVAPEGRPRVGAPALDARVPSHRPHRQEDRDRAHVDGERGEDVHDDAAGG